MNKINVELNSLQERDYDVIVIGGGPAGIAAALSSAREGARTALVERYAFLGGMMTAGQVILLPLWLIAENFVEDRALVEGFAREYFEAMVAHGATIDPNEALALYDSKRPVVPDCPAWTAFDTELTKIVTQRMLQEAGCDLLIHSKFVDVVKEGDKIKGVHLATKDGLETVMADVVIDTTGDADVADRAGVPCEQDLENPLPATLCFYMGNVDLDVIHDYLQKDPGYSEMLKKAGISVSTKVALKEFPSSVSSYYNYLPDEEDKARYRQMLRESEVQIKGLDKFKVDIARKDDYNLCEIELRDKVLDLSSFLIKNVPGFERAHISAISTQLGTRESRRIVGVEQVWIDDLDNGSVREDGICKSLKGAWLLEDMRIQKPFDIPYGALVPQTVDGLLIAGRCISIDRLSAKPFCPRDIITCMGTGQAAGIAAALSVKQKQDVRDVDVKVLREKLEAAGANISKVAVEV
jgi:hypothetical protein